jgi:hypothetical protein
MRLRPVLKILLCAAALALVTAAAASAAPLAAPFDVQGFSPRPDQIELTWKPGGEPTPGEHFLVFRDGKQIADTTGTRTVDDWLLGGHLYEYVITATNAAGEKISTDSVRIPTSDPDPLEAGPYLQELTATHVDFIWQTFEPEVTGLDLGLPDGRTINLAHDATLRQRHITRISKLRPATTYNYSWQSGGLTGTGSFKTPPNNPATFTFDVIGDFGTGSPASLANMSHIENGGSDFALTLGDNAYPNATASQYVAYVLNPMKGFFAHKPFWLAAGNHDYMGLNNYKRFFEFPGERLYYRFRYGDVLFMALDSEQFGPKQKAWAEAALARSKARCKVVYFHHPIWSSGHGYQAPGRHNRQRLFIPMLQRGGADLVLNGHIHNYERSKPLWGKRVSHRRGITYVVSGAGGAELGGFGTHRRPRWSAKRGAFPEIVRFGYRDGRFSGRTIAASGAIADRFTVRCR